MRSDFFNHETLVFTFLILCFSCKVTSKNRMGDSRFMLHEMKGGLHGHKSMKWISDDGKKMEVMVEIGEGGKVIVDIDTTYEEGGKTIRRVEKKMLKEE